MNKNINEGYNYLLSCTDVIRVWLDVKFVFVLFLFCLPICLFDCFLSFFLPFFLSFSIFFFFIFWTVMDLFPRWILICYQLAWQKLVCILSTKSFTTIIYYIVLASGSRLQFLFNIICISICAYPAKKKKKKMTLSELLTLNQNYLNFI